MKTMLLAAVAALSLAAGSAYAAGGPVGFANGGSYQEPAYSAQAFADHSQAAKVINHSSDSSRVAATPAPKG